MEQTRILFVCLGNICRSPLAEGVFQHLARERGLADRFFVESAGTGHWHVGELPDPRSRAVARKNGIELVSRARLVNPDDDFAEPHKGGFHWLVGMDRANCRNLKLLGAPDARIRLLRQFDPALVNVHDREREVPDPYTDDELFDPVFAMVKIACAGMLDALTAETQRTQRRI